MSEDIGVVQLQLEVWHPDCWTLKTTTEVSAGLLGGMQRVANNRTICRDTVYANTAAEVEGLIGKIRASPDVQSVFEIERTARDERFGSPAGNTTKEVLIETRRSANQIGEAFFSRGFVCAEPIRMENGTEHWSVLTTLDWGCIDSVLDTIREQEDAEIRVKQMMHATDGGRGSALPFDRLSTRQREVFDLARERGYYARPKKVSPRELADELEITTSTFHEHLHKAEAKLLDLS